MCHRTATMWSLLRLQAVTLIFTFLVSLTVVSNNSQIIVQSTESQPGHRTEAKSHSVLIVMVILTST